MTNQGRGQLQMPVPLLWFQLSRGNISPLALRRGPASARAAGSRMLQAGSRGDSGVVLGSSAPSGRRECKCDPCCGEGGRTWRKWLADAQREHARQGETPLFVDSPPVSGDPERQCGNHSLEPGAVL